jgi:hypothetical protein
MPKKEPKHPWLMFYTGDWLKDPALTLCMPATRGIWMDLICAMHLLDRSGELRGTADQLARTARCSTVEFVQAMTDLRTNRAADVTERNGVYEICNRRMNADYKLRKSSAERVKRHRERSRNGDRNADETPHISEVRSQNKPSSTPKQGSIPSGPLPPNWTAAAASLCEAGVRKAEDACRQAIAKGCSPEDVLNVLCHYRGKPGCWDAQDLYFRVLDLVPGDDFTQRWRAESPLAKKQVAAAKQVEKQRVAADERRKADEQHAADKAESERLEKQLGSKLDALDRPQVKKLIGELYGDGAALMIRRLPQSGPPTGNLRRELLVEIERRCQEEST